MSAAGEYPQLVVEAFHRPEADLMPEELRAAIVLFASLLDERQRRLFAGLEALKCGWGGDRRIAELLGIDPSTVADRRKKTPEAIAHIEALMDHETAGDPVRGLRWTRRTTAKVAAELCKLGTDICARTVARLLKKMGFSLRVNHKKRAGASHPNRDDRFHHIAEVRERYAVDNTPVISVDTKKKELVGAFRNTGAKWDHSPELVNDHDFRSDAEGRAIPYGIYDTRANAGTVFVGQTADTPAFAVDCIEKWWRTEGCKHYPEANAAADPGRWRRQQQLHGARLEIQPPTPPRQPARTAGECGPLPAGHVEVESHRTPPVLRGHQELGRPAARQLRDHPQVPAHHTHRHRTRVRAHRVRKTYKTGVKVTDAQMQELRITPDSSLPKWNYTIELM